MGRDSVERNKDLLLGTFSVIVRTEDGATETGVVLKAAGLESWWFIGGRARLEGGKLGALVDVEGVDCWAGDGWRVVKGECSLMVDMDGWGGTGRPEGAGDVYRNGEKEEKVKLLIIVWLRAVCYYFLNSHGQSVSFFGRIPSRKLRDHCFFVCEATI